MSKPIYPRTVFALTRNYSIQKVTLVRPQSESWDYGGYTRGGKFYNSRDLYESKEKAIKAGRTSLRHRQKSLEVGVALLAKDAAALDKAERAK